MAFYIYTTKKDAACSTVSLKDKFNKFNVHTPKRLQPNTKCILSWHMLNSTYSCLYNSIDKEEFYTDMVKTIKKTALTILSLM